MRRKARCGSWGWFRRLIVMTSRARHLERPSGRMTDLPIVSTGTFTRFIGLPQSVGDGEAQALSMIPPSASAIEGRHHIVNSMLLPIRSDQAPRSRKPRMSTLTAVITLLCSAGCAQYPSPQVTPSDQALIRAARDIYGKHSAEPPPESADIALVHLPDRTCIEVRVVSGAAAGDRTMCFDKSRRLILSYQIPS
jgi:hypothetical protein